MERLRSNVGRMNSNATSNKQSKFEFVYNEEFVRCKERINVAFNIFMRLHEETINRDSVLAEALLETQQGKNSRLICKQKVND